MFPVQLRGMTQMHHEKRNENRDNAWDLTANSEFADTEWFVWFWYEPHL
jgi:hypothetical protein